MNQSTKDENMEGVLKIEDFCECVSTSKSMWSRNWNKNVALAIEVAIALVLGESVVSGMK